MIAGCRRLHFRLSMMLTRGRKSAITIVPTTTAINTIMIGSMTEAERRQPELLASQPSRRRRIAAGSGHQPADVDKVLADFQKMRGFMQQMTRGGGMPGMPGMGGFPGMGGGMPVGAFTASAEHMRCWKGLITVPSSTDFEKKSHVPPPSPSPSQRILE